MQHFKALFKKEFSAYFSGSLAYFLIAIYLFVSFAGAFYLKSFLASKDSAVLSLFSLQPYILAVLIPAVTMKLWSEEYKSSSAEFLLTLPINLNLIILAKFCAALSFCGILSLGLLPFIFYTACFLELDFLNIFCAYIGLELLIMFFCSMGGFFSSLSNNLIVSYILSIFAFLISVALPQTDLIINYHDFLFAEIGIFDIFYFISFSCLFLYFNKMVIEYRRQANKKSTALLFSLIFASLIANSLLCWAISIFDYKIDLTAKRIYTLKSQSKEIIAQIKKPVTIDVYIASDYANNNYAIAYYFEQISRFLRKYKNNSKGMIKVNMHETKAFSDEEKMLLNKDIYAVNNEHGSKNYFGAVIKDNEGNEEIITMFLPERQSYLEEDIDRALLKVAFPEMKKSIGVYLDPQQNLDDYEGSALIWENEYNTDLLDNASYQIHNDAASVILVNPKLISPVFMYALDQYLVNGGNLIIFADRNAENQLDNINKQQIFIERLLNHWGIKLNNDTINMGEAVGKFNNSKYPLNLKSACSIDVTNTNYTTIPLIKNTDSLLGVILQGEFTSYYNKNPFLSTQIGYLMRPFKAKSKQGRVAVICDSDILNGNNWIASDSPDRDIFGALEKAGNGRFIMSLVDYMSGNDIYATLPRNETFKNTLSIGDKIEEQIKKEDEKKYAELKETEELMLALVWQLADYDEENLPTIVNLTDEGRELQSINAQINNLKYNRINKYNKYVNRLMIKIIIVLPLIETLFAIMLAFIFARRKNKRVKELLK